MNGLQALLEDFGDLRRDRRRATETAGPSAEQDLEGLRLEAFENGYKAGWDDAIKAQADDQSRVSASLGQHLLDLSFTYHEAYSHVTKAITPLLEELVGVLLPEAARATLGAHVADRLAGMAQEIGQVDVIVAVSPTNAASVAPLLEGEFGFPVRLIEDDTLADEQADIRFGETERQIDLSGLLRSITEALEGFVQDNHRNIANG